VIRRGDLIHYGDEPLGALRRTAQKPEAGCFSKFDKPRGLWVSVLGRMDWASWCRAERFRATRRQFASRIHLAPNARVLRVAGEAGIDAFSAEFGFEHRWHPNYVDTVIDWAKVAATYQGIIIAPYVWERRLHDGSDWYYPWDCASGCIWNPAAVECVEPLRVAKSKKAAAAA
jgi:hypothetical protein